MRNRKAAGETQTGLPLVPGFLDHGEGAAAVIAAVQGLGTQSNTRLEGTAGSVGNPADLKNMVDPQ